MLTIKIKTWSCSNCNYTQDFEPTKSNLKIHFPDLDLDNYECPACASGQNEVKILKRGIKMVKETDLAKKIVMNIRNTDETIDEEIKDEKTGEIKIVQKILKALAPEEIKKLRDKYEDK